MENGFKMYSKDAEEAVLGCLLLGDVQAASFIGKLSKDDFYISDCALIFDATVKSIEQAGAADLVTVSGYFKDSERERLSSIAAGFMMSVPTRALLENYVELLKEMSARRKMYRALSEACQALTSGEESKQVLAELYKLFGEEEKSVIGAISSLAVEFYEDLAKRYAKDAYLAGISTGFAHLDALLGGMQRGELVVLGARPSVGKSAFAGNIFLNAAKAGLPSMFFSYEMPSVQIVRRLVSGNAHVKNMDMRLGNLTERDFEKIAGVTNEMSALPCEIYDDCPDINEVRLRATGFKARTGDLALLVIDYLQLMPGRGKNLRDIVEYNSRWLKKLAKELNCVVLCLSQLSRAVEGRGSDEPYLSDLRESGAIEQDADVVLFLYRDEGNRKVKVAKARDGDLGTVPLVFLKDYVSFYTPRAQDAPRGQDAPREKKKEESKEQEEIEFPDVG